MKKLLIFFGLATNLIYVSCKYESLVPYQPPIETTTCSPDTVYFSQSIAPLLNSSCGTSGCHDANSHKDGVVMTDHFSIIQEVKIGNPSNSKLYKVLNENGEDRMPPAPSAPFTTAQKELIYKWIQQGAKNNSCEDVANCISTNMSFKTNISPIIDTNCKGCHNANNPSGGIDLSTFDNVKKYADSGVLVGVITQAPNYIAMPVGSKLSQCNIDKIKSWIADGSKNN